MVFIINYQIIFRMEQKKVLVTGGCGFIGSQLCEELVSRGHLVSVADNMSSGERLFLPDNVNRVYECDLTDEEAVHHVLEDTNPDLIYHLAAKSDVRSESVGVNQFEYNTKITGNIVKSSHKFGNPDILFTSSSTVYGHPDEIPVTESYDLNPISYYGAGKIGSESLLRTYQNQTEGDVKIFRLANIVGPNLRGAVIPDFIEKLSDNPQELEILGNGKQMKSYMHVEDCVNAILHITNSDATTVNIGTETTTTVDRIADTVSDVMNLQPLYDYTGGSQGWTGDVPEIKMDVSYMKSLGYSPQMSSDQAVRKATNQLVEEISDSDEQNTV